VPLSGKRIFITGGAGFIGTTLARRLVDRNDVVALDNLHRDALSGTTLAEHPNFAFHQADVLDLEAVRELALGATHIVHCAAIAGVDTVRESPVRTCPGELVFQPLPYADVELRIPNVQKARELLQFEAKVDLDEGLANTIAWYRERTLESV
jgi:nucleoside-diphosphate-sugar epimerase